MSNVMTLFKGIIIMQLFYAFIITGLAHSMPASTQTYLTGFSDVTDEINLQNVSAEVQDSLNRQTQIPVIEMGALVFYSGNILLDLLINFMFAIPQMIGLLINGIMLLFNVDSYIFAIAELFFSVVVSAMYIIGLIQLITGIRSGRII